ncbi:antibiotic biosynthesis monooxygenase [Mucilaginibacter sp. UR6-1]|uniref:putative quinol monooxygenase n=1 Tax=Mucilaginibacter sp. UR6-1 TaxID=1435643 RepID=UPI001E42E657|nr:antibiotic biosynthesis monooxygenase [Mucilaginibacter sp. UR6-1]MCC8408550.1 antibiotic biosynthesis monooxygenase [Mucilaginibacter sp. UR6-1]
MNGKPIHIFSKWRVKNGHFDTVFDLLSKVATQSVLENGNLFYKAHQCNSDANTIILFEGYLNETSQMIHQSSAHFKRLMLGKIVPLLESREVITTTPIIR